VVLKLVALLGVQPPHILIKSLLHPLSYYYNQSIPLPVPLLHVLSTQSHHQLVGASGQPAAAGANNIGTMLKRETSTPVPNSLTNLSPSRLTKLLSMLDGSCHLDAICCMFEVNASDILDSPDFDIVYK
jgi:hypothetical protein